ncbi:MAG TPA: hypothetical protein VFZ83_14670 [Acidimicrobiia bacterium]|nr:hypothetical protein [Acidimicrobiia bacterium]
MAALRFLDDDGAELRLDDAEADALLAATGGLEPATVSACPQCASRVLAVVAFVDLLDAAPPHPRTEELMELADDAPTLHLYVVDADTGCVHAAWRDPGHAEWLDAVEEPGPRLRP